MTIGIDCRFAAGSTGLSRYTREVVGALLQVKSEHAYVLFCDRSDPPWIPKNPVAKFSIKVVRAKHYSMMEQIMMPIVIITSRINLLFAPHFNVPLYCPVPFVAVIHDLILHRYPNNASALKHAAYMKQMASTIKRAKKIIAVSKFTAKEIEKNYGKQMSKKITVIHEAVSDAFSGKSGAACGPVLKKHNLDKPFFLYVGNSKEHKNVQTLIDAYGRLGSTDTELVLVTSGQEVLQLKPRQGVRILTHVPDEDLPCLYFFAACFVTASLYEGFGLPVLEAAAAGCPCILTDCGALPEIAPPGSKIVEPTVDALAEAFAEPPGPPEEKPTRKWSDVAREIAQAF